MSTQPGSGKLADAVCAVMKKVHSVRETGRNRDQNYAYASDEDLTRALQPAMADEGLCLLPVQERLPQGVLERSGHRLVDGLVLDVDATPGRLQRDRLAAAVLQQVGHDHVGAPLLRAGPRRTVLGHGDDGLVPTGEDAERDPPREVAPADPNRPLGDAEVEPFRMWLAEHLKPPRAYVPLADKSAEEIEQFHRWKATPEAAHRIAKWRESLTGGAP